MSATGLPDIPADQEAKNQDLGDVVGNVALVGGLIAAQIEIASAPGKKAGVKLGQVST